MTKIMGTFHNCETNEVVVRELNAEELELFNAQIAAQEAEKATQEKQEADKAALLSKLGITADEAKLLLG